MSSDHVRDPKQKTKHLEWSGLLTDDLDARLISFSVTNSMRDVQNAKKTVQHVRCTIDYNDYEASFNQKLWGETSKGIEEEQKKAADEFRKRQTIDCPP